MNSGIVPSRITEAREARAMSMEELAKNIGVTRQSISKYERGIISPSLGVLQDVSCALGFPVDFFYKEELPHTAGSSSLFFRSNSNIAKKVKTACKYQVKWANEIRKQLERYVNFVSMDVPALETDYENLTFDDIEELAIRIRNQWELGDRPISDLIGVLENRGIIVGEFSSNVLCSFKGIDAFSSWEDGSPYILYNSDTKSAVRTRFSLLHELGHIIMHNSIVEQEAVKKDVVELADAQADHFAAAFLLPETSFPNDVHGNTLPSIEMVKRKWGAAMSTIIKRCEQLKLFTDNQINYLRRQMTVKKYWRKEPLDDEMTIVGPEILRDAVYLLVDNKLVTPESLLTDSGLALSDFRSLCSLPDDFFKSKDQRLKPNLRLVTV